MSCITAAVPGRDARRRTLPPLPIWATWGWATVWAVGLLSPALADLTSTPPLTRPALVLLGLVVVGACFALAVAAALGTVARRGGRRHWAVFVLQGAMTAVLAAVPGLSWMTLPLMLAITAAVSLDLTAAIAVVPLVAVVGALVQHTRGEPWADAVWGTGLTTALAGSLTLALSWLGALVAELDRTRHRLARAAVVEERLRISRDLHDLLGHTLSVVVVKAQAARRSAPVDVEATVRHTSDIETVGRQALTEVREAVRGYRSSGLADEVAGAVATLAEVGVDTQVLGSAAVLGGEAQEVLGWVVREGTTNVLRHSGARVVTIAFDSGDGVASVSVRDDGGGGSVPTRDGAGICGLRERVEAVGGVLRAVGDVSGFTLTATVPVGSRSGRTRMDDGSAIAGGGRIR